MAPGPAEQICNDEYQFVVYQPIFVEKQALTSFRKVILLFSCTDMSIGIKFFLLSFVGLIF